MANQTTKNLEAAFAGESQANRRYIAYAHKAEEEGFQNLSRLFRAIAESETVHAINHLKCSKGMRSSLENVEESFRGEKEEFTDMYPMFMDQAKRDINNDALKTFYWANEAEKAHADFYEKALESLKEGQDIQIGKTLCLHCMRKHTGRRPAGQMPGLRRKPG